MKKKILIGSIIAVALLTLVSFSSVVGYNSVISDLDISVEENKEIIYQEEPSDEDCGCEEEVSGFEWMFPMICTLLLPYWGFAWFIYFSSRGMLGENLVETMAQIGLSLNCYWMGVPPRSKLI